MRKNKKRPLKKAGNKVEILGVRLNGSSASSLLKALLSRLEKGQKTFVVTPNPEFVVFARKNPWFREILNRADFAIPDGIGLVWASRFLATAAKTPPRWRIQGRLSGTDLMEKLCREAARYGWSVFLLGGELGVAKKTLAVLKNHYPGLRGWAESGPRKPKDTPVSGQISEILDSEFETQEYQRILASKENERRPRRPLPEWRRETEGWIKKINQKHPNLLFVAFGMGKQEKFIWDNWDQLDVKLAMGVGGAFDYLSGKVPRAPLFIRKIGFEWFYRLLIQPWRWKRQLALAEFCWLVLREIIFC